jgi:two-component system cell cycle response regulator
METIKVLVVDDNKAHAEGLVELLGLSGFESTFVLNGLDAVRMAEQLSVDAVLLDMGLPDIKGYEVCRRLRINPITANVAVIFHTGSQPLPSRDHQADAFLTFPISTIEVFAVIRGCVERRKAKHAHQKTTDGVAASI